MILMHLALEAGILHPANRYTKLSGAEPLKKYEDLGMATFCFRG